MGLTSDVGQELLAPKWGRTETIGCVFQ
jgi:hypothetical protein